MIKIKYAQLNAYLSSLTIPESRRYLKRCGTTEVGVRSLCHVRKPLPLGVVLRLVRESEGAILLKDLSEEAESAINLAAALANTSANLLIDAYILLDKLQAVKCNQDTPDEPTSWR